MMALHLLAPAVSRTAARSGVLFHYRSTRNLGSVTFGICFDIDGVIARGLSPLPGAVEAFKLLCDHSTGKLKVPTVFLTNGFSLNNKKAKWLNKWLNVEVKGEQVVQAHSPLKVFHSLKDKHCLVIGQGPVVDIARNDLGMKNVIGIEEVSAAYPLLDVVDHEKCYAAAELSVTESDMPPHIDTIVVFGEPKQWETPLQLIIDLLLTSGKPCKGNPRCFYQTLPIVVCNPDLQYMGRALYPRFGNGAFLLCLEALFKKVTGVELEYSTIVGKPSEITYRYAEHCLAAIAHDLSPKPQPIKTMYMIGDNAEVDIIGANLYGRYIGGATIPAARGLSSESGLYPQTVTRVESILVGTGVQTANMATRQPIPSSIRPAADRYVDRASCCRRHCHRDFVGVNNELFEPTHRAADILEAVHLIVDRERLDI